MERTNKSEGPSNMHLLTETLHSMQGELEAFRQWLKKNPDMRRNDDVKDFIYSIAMRNHLFNKELNKVIKAQRDVAPLFNPVDDTVQNVLHNVQQLLRNRVLEQKLIEMQRSLWVEFKEALELTEKNMIKVSNPFKIEKTTLEQLD